MRNAMQKQSLATADYIQTPDFHGHDASEAVNAQFHKLPFMLTWH
jgi:hypothetical protein